MQTEPTKRPGGYETDGIETVGELRARAHHVCQVARSRGYDEQLIRDLVAVHDAICWTLPGDAERPIDDVRATITAA